MNLKKDWNKIRQVFDSAGQSSLHFSVASIDAQGYPHITPIGSLILRDDCTGYYFEELPALLPDNLNRSRHVAVLALNSDPSYWMTSLSSGKFETYPGVRLTGVALERREGSIEEINAWQQKVKFAEGLKGHDILWKNMRMVRDIEFTDVRPVECGEMTAHLH